MSRLDQRAPVGLIMPIRSFAHFVCLVIISGLIGLEVLSFAASAGLVFAAASGIFLDGLWRYRQASNARDVVKTETPATLTPALSTLAERLSQGDFAARLESDGGGDSLLASNVNSALDMINSSVDEALALADVSSNGDLTARASARYPGHAGALTKALNGLLDGLSDLASTLGDAVEQNDQRSASMAKVASSLNERSHDQAAATATVARRRSI